MYKVDLTIAIGTWNLTLSMKMQFVMINDVTKKNINIIFPERVNPFRKIQKCKTGQ